MNKLKKYFYTAITIILFLSVYACDSNLVYTESKNIDSKGWFKSDTLIFSPQVADISQPYNVYVWVRHTKDFENSNLWLKVISEPTITKDSTFLVNLPIADKTGKWLGDCSASLCTQKYLLKENFMFESAEAFKVEVLQYMRAEELQEVKNVGLEIEKINN